MKHHLIALGVGIVVGYLFANKLNAYPILTTAYNTGAGL
jgi:xanthosine utilization system XapX-like protein